MPIPGKNHLTDRRKGPDFWVRLVKTVSVLVWGLMLVILFVIDRAKPDFENFFSRLFHVSLRRNWDVQLLEYAFYLSLGAFWVSLLALLVNKKRHRRRTDRYSKSVLVTLVFSLAVIVFYLAKTY